MLTQRTLHLRILVIPLLLLSVVATATAQNTYKLGGKSQMTLNGTSTMHDWTMTAKSFSSTATMTVTKDNDLASIDALSLTLPVQNLKSTKSSMDENAYEALNTDKYKDITFRLTSAKVTPAGDKFKIVAVGNLTISGVTRSITMNSEASIAADGTVSCSGSVPLKLSDFKIERPSFMFGTMSVGDALSLSYAVQFVKQGLPPTF
jgi:polyisoprenoid-binding protein YceI